MFIAHYSSQPCHTPTEFEFREKMENLLNQGTTVLVDRYVHSGLAYSMAKVEYCKTDIFGAVKTLSVTGCTAELVSDTRERPSHTRFNRFPSSGTRNCARTTGLRYWALWSIGVPDSSSSIIYEIMSWFMAGIYSYIYISNAIVIFIWSSKRISQVLDATKDIVETATLVHSALQVVINKARREE